MRATCIINNYNYGDFLIEAIESCINQTKQFDEIIIVDDGSTDHSLQVAKQYCDNFPVVRLIAKSNGGQLSCFDVGFQASTGDVVFFLDADDIYEMDYLAKALNYYEAHPSCDFLFCGLREFDLSDKIIRWAPNDVDFGYTALLNYALPHWIGAQTSAISIKRSLLMKILPLPLWSDWITRADDCLVFGASLAGGRKMYMDAVLVRYRVHGNNLFTGRKIIAEKRYERILALERMYHYFHKKYQIKDSMLRFLYCEFRILHSASFYQLKKYVRATLMANISFFTKGVNVFKICGHYIFCCKKHSD